jgi:hypothetical protein
MQYLTLISAYARRKKSAPLLGRPTFLRSPSLQFFSFLLRRTLSGEVGDMQIEREGLQMRSERARERLKWGEGERKRKYNKKLNNR